MASSLVILLLSLACVFLSLYKRRTPRPKGKEFSFLHYHNSSSPDSPSADHNQQTPAVSVKQDASWSYCGPSLTSTDLPANFQEFADATFAGPVPPSFYSFVDFVKPFLAEHGLSNYLLTVRATTPTAEYDRPRWHTDEFFFSGLNGGGLPGTKLGAKATYREGSANGTEKAGPDGTSWKICTALLGPQTLFIPLEHQTSARDLQRQARQAASTEHECISIRCVGCASAAETVRDQLAHGLSRYGVQVAAPGQCVFFQVGRDTGAVHSEPRMSGLGEDGEVDSRGRIFINVVPGTEDELRGMMDKWGMQFPRQWWIGSNVVRKPVKKAAA